MIVNGKVWFWKAFGIALAIAHAESRVTVTAPPFVRRWVRFCSEVSVIVAPAEVWKFVPSAAVFAAFIWFRNEMSPPGSTSAPFTCIMLGRLVSGAPTPKEKNEESRAASFFCFIVYLLVTTARKLSPYLGCVKFGLFG